VGGRRSILFPESEGEEHDVTRHVSREDAAETEVADRIHDPGGERESDQQRFARGFGGAGLGGRSRGPGGPIRLSVHLVETRQETALMNLPGPADSGAELTTLDGFVSEVGICV
jgi:hypothetical protein